MRRLDIRCDWTKQNLVMCRVVQHLDNQLLPQLECLCLEPTNLGWRPGGHTRQPTALVPAIGHLGTLRRFEYNVDQISMQFPDTFGAEMRAAGWTEFIGSGGMSWVRQQT